MIKRPDVMRNYAIDVLNSKLDEITFYMEMMKSISPYDYHFYPDYDNLRQKRRHLMRVIAIIKLMDLNAV